MVNVCMSLCQCHYVIMLALSSAHYSQCVVGCLYIFVNSTLELVVRLSLFSLSMHLRMSSYFGCFGLSYFRLKMSTLV